MNRTNVRDTLCIAYSSDTQIEQRPHHYFNRFRGRYGRSMAQIKFQLALRSRLSSCLCCFSCVLCCFPRVLCYSNAGGVRKVHNWVSTKAMVLYTFLMQWSTSYFPIEHLQLTTVTLDLLTSYLVPHPPSVMPAQFPCSLSIPQCSAMFCNFNVFILQLFCSPLAWPY